MLFYNQAEINISATKIDDVTIIYIVQFCWINRFQTVQTLALLCNAMRDTNHARVITSTVGYQVFGFRPSDSKPSQPCSFIISLVYFPQRDLGLISTIHELRKHSYTTIIWEVYAERRNIISALITNTNFHKCSRSSPKTKQSPVTFNIISRLN